MNEKTNLPKIYPLLVSQLQGLKAPMSAAESHGLLCARFCTEAEPTFQSWADEVLGPHDAADLNVRECLSRLQQLFEASRGMFGGLEHSLALFLPADDVDIGIRSRALADWCSGFVAGLGLGGLTAETGYNEAVREVLVDLIEISRLDDEVDGTEEDEGAYMELVEYIRVGVKTIEMELDVAPRQHTVH